MRRATPASPRGLTLPLISIHALLAESDQLFGAVCEPNSDFNPRSPCGERRLGRCHSGDRHRISIHALLAESDVMFSFFPVKVCRFQSTLSLRRATIFSDPGHWTELFQSTLSLRRATPDRYSLRCVCLYFNPRSPCGERQANGVASLDDSGFQSTLSLRRATESIPFRFIFIGFQSTLSLRRATALVAVDLCVVPISIHALLAESDQAATAPVGYIYRFQSTLSLRRATGTRQWAVGRALISIHALLAESDEADGSI